MKPTLQSIRFDAAKKLTEFIEDHIQKLELFFDEIIRSAVILNIEKSDDNSNMVAEIKIKISGDDLFAKKRCLFPKRLLIPQLML